MTTEIEVEVVHALPGHSEALRLSLPAGSCVADALRRAAALGFAPAALADASCLAVFGRAATTATPLHPGDRVELLRPLLADPKQRRRERAGRGKA
jgi:putative ubiquitin-RnfH superfamily antitoxin RatB of RatAB toxin-antitoxin module